MSAPAKKATNPVSSVNSGVKGEGYKSQLVKDVPKKGVEAIDKENTPKKAPGSVRV